LLDEPRNVRLYIEFSLGGVRQQPCAESRELILQNADHYFSSPDPAGNLLVWVFSSNGPDICTVSFQTDRDAVSSTRKVLEILMLPRLPWKAAAAALFCPSEYFSTCYACDVLREVVTHGSCNAKYFMLAYWAF